MLAYYEKNVGQSIRSSVKPMPPVKRSCASPASLLYLSLSVHVVVHPAKTVDDIFKNALVLIVTRSERAIALCKRTDRKILLGKLLGLFAIQVEYSQGQIHNGGKLFKNENV